MVSQPTAGCVTGGGRCSDTGLLHGSGTWIQVTPVLMNIDIGKVAVVFEAVIDTVAMMGIDIHIGNAVCVKAFAKQFHSDAAVVENAEAGGAVPGRVM